MTALIKGLHALLALPRVTRIRWYHYRLLYRFARPLFRRRSFLFPYSLPSGNLLCLLIRRDILLGGAPYLKDLLDPADLLAEEDVLSLQCLDLGIPLF